MKGKAWFMIRKRYLYAVLALMAIMTVASAFSFFLLYFHGKIYPGIRVLSVELGGLSRTEAEGKLSQAFKLPEEILISLENHDNFTISTETIGAQIDYARTAEKAYKIGRGDTIKENITFIFKNLFKKTELELLVDVNSQELEAQIALVSTQISDKPEAPSLTLAEDGSLEYHEGKPGFELNQKGLFNEIIRMFKKGDTKVLFSLKHVDPTLSQEEKEIYIKRSSAILPKAIVFISPERKFVYEKQQLLSLLRPKGGYLLTESQIPEEISVATNSAPQNPVFKYENNKVVEFLPAKDGLMVNKSEIANKIETALLALESSDIDLFEVEIPLAKKPPDFKTEDVNDLGIKELIGVGTSSFKGSIPPRVHNVALAASKLNGVLILPGEIFSFAKALGDISVYTGYKQAYIIQGNQTILGDGGGVCQVSTTFFRASLAAGLPIIERHAHSYRVGYYEQDSPVGIDATIYSPTIDMKIKNDTPGHILIQTFTDTKNMTLRFEFYGTPDGRVSYISKPVVGNTIAPPEDLYIDDPTLPRGEIKQIDHKAWGAKVNFNYKVERDGEIVFEENYFSNYRPWQAKFLRGTAN